MLLHKNYESLEAETSWPKANRIIRLKLRMTILYLYHYQYGELGYLIEVRATMQSRSDTHRKVSSKIEFSWSGDEDSPESEQAGIEFVNCYNYPTRDERFNLQTINVNHGFARKTKEVSKIDHHYPKDRPRARQVWNTFNVIPRRKSATLHISVMERHPYTTQTFIPMGSSVTQIEYIAVVAEDLNGEPDMTSFRAWLCHGGQAGRMQPLILEDMTDPSVTYGANQWHAPMIALRGPMVFCVTNAENGTTDDLEEHYFTTEKQPLLHIGDLDSYNPALAGRTANL